MDIAHIQGKTQPLPDRVHAPSKLLTFMEISRSFTCLSGTELLVHTTQRQLDAYVWPLQQTMSLLIQIIVPVPKLAKQDCGRATEEPCCARCTKAPWKQLHWSHWSWLWKKFVRNLTDFTNLLDSLEYAESTSCWQSWCHRFFKLQLIHCS